MVLLSKWARPVRARNWHVVELDTGRKITDRTHILELHGKVEKSRGKGTARMGDGKGHVEEVEERMKNGVKSGLAGKKRAAKKAQVQ